MPAATIVELVDSLDPFEGCLDSFETFDRNPPKDIYRKAWNRTNVGKLSLSKNIIEEREDSTMVEGFLENRLVYIKCELRSKEM